MTLNRAKGRMFKSVGWTWNPIVGCSHDCPYCWAKKLCERYNRSFDPRIIYRTLLDQLPDDGTWIFLGSMGDLFCWGLDEDEIREVLTRLDDYEGSNKFLLQTKNPTRAIRFLDELYELDDKIIIGTTIETNRATLGNAPPSYERYAAMVFFKKLEFKTFLSLEPLAEFDLIPLFNWIKDIEPEAVEIGLENYSNFLSRPAEQNIKDLLFGLNEIKVPVILKDNLVHLESQLSKELRNNPEETR